MLQIDQYSLVITSTLKLLLRLTVLAAVERELPIRIELIERRFHVTQQLYVHQSGGNKIVK